MALKKGLRRQKQPPFGGCFSLSFVFSLPPCIWDGIEPYDGIVILEELEVQRVILAENIKGAPIEILRQIGGVKVDLHMVALGLIVELDQHHGIGHGIGGEVERDGRGLTLA